MHCLLSIAALVAVVSAKIYFNEPFDDDKAWAPSTKVSNQGKLLLSTGRFFGSKLINQGYQTSQDARFYASSAPLATPFSNDGKDFVVSLSVKHEQGLDCGGGYVKLLPEGEASDFHGESPYLVMFGPDQCGYNRRVHVIFNYNGENLLWKKELRYPDDKLTHVYTLRVKPSNTYEVYIDQELKESGNLEDDWSFLKPKKIDDTTDKKPADWEDSPTIEDPEDTKPADWDSEPEKIADKDAKQPEDWDEKEDGAWEPPMIANPKYKGEWSAKRISNPKYKGEWKPRQIDNPDYKPDTTLYLLRKPIARVGIDVWQVKSGTIFDNILIGDDLGEVNGIIEKTWGSTKEDEKSAEKKFTDDEGAKSKATEKAPENEKDAANEDAANDENDENA